MAAYKDYYKVLGVPKTATQKEIRSAFRKLAAKYHPDRNPDDPSAEDKFKEVNEANTVLGDEEKRKFYDQYGTADGQPPFGADFGGAGGNPFGNVPPGQAADFSDFFQTLFGGGGFTTSGGGFAGQRDPFGGYSQVPRAPRKVEAELELDLMKAYRGGDTAITVDGRAIDVTIPKGARDGSKLRLRGQAPGGGDLYLVLKLKPSSTFKLQGDNVRVTVDVADYRAVLGGTVKVPTLDGEVDMTLPRNTRAGRVLRLKGQGWRKRDGSRGDELAEIRITTPETPSDEMVALYQKLAELAQDPVVS